MTTHKTLHPRDDIDYMYQEKKEEEDSLALRTELTHQQKDSVIILEKCAHGVMVVVWNGQGDTNSNPGQGRLHFTLH